MFPHTTHVDTRWLIFINLFMPSYNRILEAVQGLEFDYIGVIIGGDLRFENGNMVTDPFKRAKTDKSLSGFKTSHKKNKEEALRLADQIIKNTYRTLMTRGMKGCYIYCVDPSLMQYFRRRMKRVLKTSYMPTTEILMKVAEETAIYVTKKPRD
jgi:uncharacterized protein